MLDADHAKLVDEFVNICDITSFIVFFLLFSDVVQTLKTLSKFCVLRLCVDRFHFIISPENMGQRGAMVWCTLDQTHFFSEYNMKGVTAEDNEIYLEFAPGINIIN